MSKSFLHCRYIFASLALVALARANLSAKPPVISYDPQAGGVRLVEKAEVGGEVRSQFVVTAKGLRAVSELHGNCTGVLFQATVRPHDSLKSLPIKLSYRPKGDHDAVLHVTAGDHRATVDAPAWVWAVAARFADHEATGAVTMIDEPQTAAEKRFARRWRADNSGRRLVWARYHPAVDDTVMGFFLAAADAMIGDAQHVRTMPEGLMGFENYCGYPTAIDRAKSSRAARTLDNIISLAAQPGDVAMLNDVDETFVFTIDDGKLRISGMPRYHFSRKNITGEFQEFADLTATIRANGHLLAGTNPLVHQTVADFARLVAFFNYIDETDPQQLDKLVDSLQPVLDRMPTMETPIAVPLSLR